MDKIQTKMVELKNNLGEISNSISKNETEGLSNLILFLQFDIPLEESIKNYNRSSQRNQNDNELLKLVLRQLQRYIIKNDINGSQIQVVYKEAYDIAGQMIKRIDRESHKSITATRFAPYPQKAAL